MAIGTDFPRLELSLPEFLVTDADGWIHFHRLRLGLASVIRAYSEGFSPEAIGAEYPAISLATVHKTIAFYLDHRSLVDRYLEDCDADMKAQRDGGTHIPPLEELRRRLSGQETRK